MLNVPLGVDGGVDDVAAPAEATAVDPAVGANSRSAMYRSPHLPAPAQLRQRRRADQEPGDEPRAGPPVPRNLNSGMDASSAARNLREHFSEKLGQTWEEHRRVVLSEMSLSGALFASTLCYECLPTVLAGLLCNLIEGPIATKNRGLVSMHGTTPSQIPGKLLSLLATDLTFTTQSATIALIIYVSMYRDHLTASAPFEVFGMIFLTMVAKAFIIAFKYAFKSDLLTSRTEDICLHTEKYEQTKQRDRGQMVCYVLNFVGGDLQKDELISLLYKSSLIANTDLSCTSFSWHPIAEQLARAQGRWGSARSPSELDSVQAPTGARSQGTAGGEGHQNVAQQLWDVMLEITKTVDAAEVFDQTDTDKSGDITLAEMQVRAKAAAGDRYDEEEVRREFEALDVDGNQRLSADELAKRHVKTSRLLMFGAKDGLLGKLLREDEQTLRARVEAGELPASVLATLIVLECSFIPAEVGGKYFWGLLFAPSAVIASVPTVVRAAWGLPVMGTGNYQIAFNVCVMWLMLWTAMPILIYFCLPCIWLFRQQLMCQRLLALISRPKGLTFKWKPTAQAPQRKRSTAAHEKGTADAGQETLDDSMQYGAERGDLGDLHLDQILLDLRSHSNVTAWAALWRVLHGRAFGPAVQVKFQFYCTIMTGVFLLSAVTDAVADVVLDPADLGKDFKITSIVRMILFTCPLIAQTILSFSINRYPQEYVRALTHAMTSNASTAAALLRPRGAEDVNDTEARVAREELRAELLEANQVIAAVIEEINVAAESEPMRVLFLRAELGIVTIISSCIFTVVGFQLRGFVKTLYA